MEHDDMSPETAELGARLERFASRPDDATAVARVGSDLESRVASAPGRRASLGRSAAWLVAAAIPLVGAAAIAVSLVAHPQSNRLAPLAPATPAVSPLASPTPSAVRGAPLLFSIHMFSASTGWAELYGTTRGVAHTTDGGRTWAVVRFVSEVRAADFVGVDEAWVATGGPPPAGGPSGAPTGPTVVDHTTDGGKSWTHGKPFATSGTPDLIWMIGATGWLGTDLAGPSKGGVVYATVDGATWGQVASPPACPDGTNSSRGELTFLPDRSTGLLTSSCGGAGPILFVTHDGARTWSTAHLPAPAGYRKDVNGAGSCATERPVFFGRSIGFVTGACGFTTGANPLQYPALYATVDGGISWTARPLPEAGALQMSSATTGYLVGVSRDYRYTFYTTRDGGRTWAKPPQPPFLDQGMTELNFLDSQVGWALVTRGKPSRELWVTRDGGVTWEDLHTQVE